MSQIYEFAIAKNRLIGVVIASVGASLLIYAAGVVTGLIVFPRTELARALIQSHQPAQPPISEPVVPVVAESLQKTETVEPADATPTPDVAQAAPIPSPAPTPVAAPTPAKSSPTEKGELSILVASFQDRENADRLSRTLQRAGFGAADVTTVVKSKQTWHVVRLGPYSEWANAQRVAEQIQDTYELQPFIRPRAEN
jgi:cell division septation protein DedD